jgi:hypothetical protein
MVGNQPWFVSRQTLMQIGCCVTARSGCAPMIGARANKQAASTEVAVATAHMLCSTTSSFYFDWQQWFSRFDCNTRLWHEFPIAPMTRASSVPRRVGVCMPTKLHTKRKRIILLDVTSSDQMFFTTPFPSFINTFIKPTRETAVVDSLRVATNAAPSSALRSRCIRLSTKSDAEPALVGLTGKI